MKKMVMAIALACAAVFADCPGRRLFVGISDACNKNHNNVEEYYARALERCGHIPFIIPKTTDADALARILDRADAVIISGGRADVNPVLYGEKRHPRASEPDPFRDEYDSAILRYAARRRMPVLGICRGEQIMNVFFGGSLHQHVPDVFDGSNGKPVVKHGRYSYFGAATNPPTHTVSIVPGTKLTRLLGTNVLAVASHHHQAVNRLAPGFRVSAFSPDGSVEAIESETLPMIGVQFHPETVVAERPKDGFELERLERLFRCIGDYAALSGADNARVESDAAIQSRIEREVAAACCEIDERQATLSDRCSLADYRALVRAVNGTNMWTAALQKALDEHEIVTIPASSEKYFFDGTVIVPSRRRIEARGATIRLADGMRTVLLRNASAQDGTFAPIPASAGRDSDIAVVGGRWEDCCVRRAGYGRTGMFNLLPRRKGNYFGVSTMFFFNNVDRISVTGTTFHHTGGFAVQAGDADAVAFRDITFDRCFADGLHLNGNLSRVLARNVRGQVGDDLVALNAYDWLNSSVDFGPQRYILCEDLELVRLPGVPAYPAIRIQPAKYKYADGSVVDCAISDVIFRRVKGVTTYKMYLQTPRYQIGSEPEWSEVGSGGNLFFENLEIDLDSPIDKIGQYVTQEAPRGHFAAFEFGANLSLVHFKDIDITFHSDKWPLTHLVQVGPKSCFFPGKDGKPGMEIFDPYVSCRVGRVVLENVRARGTPPKELVHSAAFDDINRDGRSTGRGVIEKIEKR